MVESCDERDRASALRRDGVAAEAVVVSVERPKRRRIYDARVTYRFHAGESDVQTSESIRAAAAPDSGDRIRLLYDHVNPQVCASEEWIEENRTLRVLFWSALLFLFLGALGVLGLVERRRG